MRSLKKKNRIIPKVKNSSKKNLYNLNLKSVCIDRPVGGIGDILMASVAMREFKRCNPSVKLTVALDRHTTYDDTYYKLLINAPFIDKFEDSRYVVRENYCRYFNIRSVCIEHEHSGRPTMNRIDIFAKACKIRKIQDRIPFYKETDEEEIKADKIFKKYKNNLKFFIHSASNEGKRSYHWQNVKKLINLLKREYPNSIIFVSDFACFPIRTDSRFVRTSVS